MSERVTVAFDRLSREQKETFRAGIMGGLRLTTIYLSIVRAFQ